MKQLIISCLTAGLLTLGASAVFAAGTGTNMGLLSTVISDEAFDAFRSPALLLQHKGSMSLGIEGVILAYESYDVSGSGNTGGSAINFTFDDPDVSEWEGSFVFATKLGTDMAVAAAVTHSSSEDTSKMVMTIPDFTFTINSTDEETTAQTDVYLSFGYRLSPNLTFGAGVQGSYLSSEAKEVESDSGGDSSTENNDTTEMTYTGILGILYVQGDMQIGATLDSGTYSRVKNDFRKTGTDPSTYSISENMSYEGRWTDSPALTLGYAQRVSPLVRFGAEAGVRLARSFDTKAATEESGVIEIITEQSEVSMSYFAGGGVALDLSDQMILAFGIRYQTYELETRKVTSSETSEMTATFQTIMAIIGIEYFLTPATIVNVFGLYRNTEMEMDLTNTAGPMTIDRTRTTGSLDVGFSVTQRM